MPNETRVASPPISGKTPKYSEERWFTMTFAEALYLGVCRGSKTNLLLALLFAV
ncbi:hypothetical protein ACVIIV_003944 [Bradyrhizobium sp. USDA 4354]